MARPERADRPERGGRQTTQTETKENGYLKRGSAILETAEKEHEKAERRAELRKSGMGNVFDFWINPGEDAEIIVLDESVDDAVAIYEHNFKMGGTFGHHEPCVKDRDSCPVCDKFGEETSYYALMLTVLDLRGYDRKPKDGEKVGEHVPHSRKLMRVKSGQMTDFIKLMEACKEENGTSRGMYLLLARDKGDKTPRIGKPQLLKGGKLYAWYDEDSLVKEFGNDAIMGRDNKTVVKPQDEDITAYDYDKLFPEPNVEELRERYGVGHPAGSRAANRRAIEEQENDQIEGVDSSVEKEPEPPARGRTARADLPERPARGGGREEQSPAPPQPSRSRERGAAPTTPPPRTRSRDAFRGAR